MRNNEADRKAYQRHVNETRQAKRIANWLQENPEVGQLNCGKYYRIEDGETVYCNALDQI